MPFRTAYVLSVSFQKISINAVSVPHPKLNPGKLYLYQRDALECKKILTVSATGKAQTLCHEGALFSARHSRLTDWAARDPLQWKTAEASCFPAAHCFCFNSTARTKAWTQTKTLSFTYIANLEHFPAN